MWDPYGSVGHLPVAVVNEDKPVDYDGTTLSVGKDMVEELRENDSMAFNFVVTAVQLGWSGKRYLLYGNYHSGRLFRKCCHTYGR